ncbi:hypothetical protein [Nitratidesulfovibrio vulgaris]|uniref:Uncharacterized protein n=1 Tax=Nitratidesulfovibrio vulgaris (strain DP4) TaxID=391774 RepID=A0A0H3A6H3_NITV4|nr:hypothetical protein [Nitratidesulfovibrio vulgaris]ABM27881.1 hypothetical protein Dvul_0860 [Nitratidesulfovibrio vulgaris DP4]
MSIFTRGIPTPGLNALHVMVNEAGDNWWKDLLSLWRPSGHPCGNDGLRLAIRNGYLNFYFQGQSIAKVCFGHGGVPRIETHVKYVADGQKGQSRAKLIGNQICLPHGDKTLPYNGVRTLREWISRASQYTHNEKRFVDEIVGANESVIDVEMGLPAWGTRTSALRVDFVTLAQKAGETCITCWEAKLMSDARLCSEADPKVLQQIQNYKDFFKAQGHGEHVQTAYREACRLHVQFKAMAEQCGHPGVALSNTIISAAEGTSSLTIHSGLQLVILNDSASGESKHWPMHEAKLKQRGTDPIYFAGSAPAQRRLPESIA